MEASATEMVIHSMKLLQGMFEIMAVVSLLEMWTLLVYLPYHHSLSKGSCTD